MSSSMEYVVHYLLAALFWGLYTGLTFGAQFYSLPTVWGPAFLILFTAVLASLGVTLYNRFRINTRRGFKTLGFFSLALAFLPAVSAITLFAGAFAAELSGYPTNVFVVGLGRGAMYAVLSLPLFGLLAVFSFTTLATLNYRARRASKVKRKA